MISVFGHCLKTHFVMLLSNSHLQYLSWLRWIC